MFTPDYSHHFKVLKDFLEDMDGKKEMSKMLSTEDVIILIEEKYNTKVWNICGVGKGAPIEGTEFTEIWIMVYNKQDCKFLENLFKDVLNITKIIHTGHPKPAEAYQI